MIRQPVIVKDPCSESRKPHNRHFPPPHWRSFPLPGDPSPTEPGENAKKAIPGTLAALRSTV